MHLILINYIFCSNTDDVPLSLTYFIQYDTTFGSIRQTNTKSNKETKFIRTYAKKQMGQGKKFVEKLLKYEYYF